MADNQAQSQPQQQTSESSNRSAVENTENVETVEVHEATDEELETVLAELDADDSDYGLDEDADSSEEDFEHEDGDADPASLDEGDNADHEVEQPAESEDDLRSQLRALQESHAQLMKQLTSVSKQQENQSQFIARRETELGQLRKNIQALSQQLQHKLETEGDVMSTRETVETMQKLNELKERDSEAQFEQSKLQTQRVAEKFIEPYPELHNDMLFVLNHDAKKNGSGITRDFAEGFLRDPYAYAGPDAYVHLANRAKLTRENAILSRRVQELEAQLKTTKTSPRDAIKKVNTALKTTPTHLRSTEGKSSNGISTISPSDVARMSDKQLAELETQLGLR